MSFIRLHEVWSVENPIILEYDKHLLGILKTFGWVITKNYNDGIVAWHDFWAKNPDNLAIHAKYLRFYNEERPLSC